jgi:hypothetical protein
MVLQLDVLDGSGEILNPEAALRERHNEPRECMSNGPRTTLHGRDAKTGQFATVKEARQHPSTHVVERVPKPGFGDTKKK